MQSRRLLAMPALAALLAVPVFAAQVPKLVCAGCHSQETSQYLKSSMGRSLLVPEPLPSGRVQDTRADATLTSEQRDGRMIHGLTEHGISAEYPVQYQIGAGFLGRTYMVRTGDYLFESPLSHFTRYGWDLSPGYAKIQLIDFDRVVDDQCLSCHSSGARFADTDEHRLQANINLQSITCDRCHGPTEAHVRHPSNKNILNPAKMSGTERDSVCEQCHLEGATRILNPGKSWNDFQVGQRTEEIFATFLMKGGNAQDVIAVSQSEQLAESMCSRGSASKLWCGTCHNPHKQAVDRQKEIRTVCLSCHPTLSAVAHPATVSECTSCHMPTSSTTDIPHAALTDHRLLRRPSATPAASSSEQPHVAVWREPAPEWRKRDMGLAETFIGFSKGVPAIGEQGVQLLKSLPPERVNNDSAVLSDLEGLALQTQDLQTAVTIGRRSVELQPGSAKAAMNFGLVLERTGDFSEAERQLRHATDLDHSLKQAYVELAMLYESQGRKQEVADTLDRYLRFNPQDIAFRLQKQQLAP